MIAPKLDDLDHVPTEVMDVVNYLKPTLLQGTVTKRDVVEACHGNQNIIWFATHCDSSGLYLSDGVMSADELVQAIAGSLHARGLYLNTCEGLSVAARVHSGTGIQVICTPVGEGGMLDDEMGAVTGGQLAYQLSRGFTFQEAYAQTASRHYLMLGSAFPLHEKDHQRIDIRLSSVEHRLGVMMSLTTGVGPMVWWLIGVVFFMVFTVLVAAMLDGVGPAWYHPASGVLTSAVISIFCLTKGLGYRFKP